MKITKLAKIVLGSALLVGTTSAHAIFTEYFGEDLNPGFTVPAGGNAATARAGFLGNLSGGVGVEDFESFGLGTTAPLSINFPGSSGAITATIAGNGCVEASAGGGCTGANSVGRFNTSAGGDQWWESTDQFSISFSSGISAFGFYATDIGDFNGQVTLTAANGTVTNITLSNTVGAPNGALLFYGFTDTSNSYTSITFGNTAAGTDFFGFDDMVIGDLAQIIASEPGILGLLGIGLLGAGFASRRRKAA